jgi:hypothetical protein
MVVPIGVFNRSCIGARIIACRSDVTAVEQTSFRGSGTVADPIINDVWTPPDVQLAVKSWPEAVIGTTWPEPLRRLRRKRRVDAEQSTSFPISAWGWASAIIGIGLLVTDTHFRWSVCLVLSLNFWCATAWIASVVSWELGVVIVSAAVLMRGSAMLFPQSRYEPLSLLCTPRQGRSQSHPPDVEATHANTSTHHHHTAITSQREQPGPDC